MLIPGRNDSTILYLKIIVVEQMDSSRKDWVYLWHLEGANDLIRCIVTSAEIRTELLAVKHGSETKPWSKKWIASRRSCRDNNRNTVVRQN
jgi:hypothetical protein